MRLYLNGAKDTITQEILPKYPKYARYLGWLNTPYSCYNFRGLQKTQLPIACDNGCYTGLNEQKFLNMLNRARKQAVIEWIACPDVVADAKATHQRFKEWKDRLKGLPLAYVLQDGSENIEIPFQEVYCLFIGGTTEFKLSHTAYDIVKCGKRHGKKIHMGRVNSDTRLRIAFRFGCDSVDGTGYVRFRNREILPALHLIDGLHRQGDLTL